MNKLRAVVEVTVGKRSRLTEKDLVRAVKDELIPGFYPDTPFGRRRLIVKSYERVRRREITEISGAHIARIAKLEKALKAVVRLHFPATMSIAQQELADGRAPVDSDLVYSFMGSGGSDQVTYGQFEKAMTEATMALYGDNVSSEEKL